MSGNSLPDEEVEPQQTTSAQQIARLPCRRFALTTMKTENREYLEDIMSSTRGTKFVAVLAVGVIVAVLLVACATQASPTAVPASEAPLKVAGLFSQKISGSAFDENAYQGLQYIKEQLGAEVAYSESVQVTDIENVLRKYADEGYNLIFGNGFEYGDPMLAVGPSYPNVAFVNITGAVEGPNVMGLDYAQHEMGYVAGVVAASMTSSGKIGFITGMTSPSVVRIGEAFKLAATATNPEVEVSVVYTGSWTDVEKAREAAVAMVQNGADVLFHDVGPGGPAVIQTAKESNIWAIGYGKGDVESAPDTVLTSPTVDMNALMLIAAQQVKSGTFSGGRLVPGYRDGVLGIDTLNKAIPSDVAAKIQKVIDDIKSGALVVPEITEMSQ